MAGMDMLLGAMGFTPDKMKELFATFENMKNGVVEFKAAINTLNENQQKEALRAEERHKELIALIVIQTGDSIPDNEAPDKAS